SLTRLMKLRNSSEFRQRTILSGSNFRTQCLTGRADLSPPRTTSLAIRSEFSLVSHRIVCESGFAAANVLSVVTAKDTREATAALEKAELYYSAHPRTPSAVRLMMAAARAGGTVTETSSPSPRPSHRLL